MGVPAQMAANVTVLMDRCHKSDHNTGVIASKSSERTDQITVVATNNRLLALPMTSVGEQASRQIDVGLFLCELEHSDLCNRVARGG